KSKNDGVMHACGHDGHTATLLVLAKVLKTHQENIPGTVVFLHQHAEEQPPGGAKPIVESGAIDHVDAVVGNHLCATTEFGKIETKEGSFMAVNCSYDITIQRKRGHGTDHRYTKDGILIAAQNIFKF